jgi:hypothetical protein
MKILIKKGNEVVNRMTIGQWVNSCEGDEFFALIDRRLSISESVQRYNQNMECGNDPHRAEVVWGASDDLSQAISESVSRNNKKGTRSVEQQANQIAKEFSKVITSWLGEETMMKVIQENHDHIGTQFEGCCATGNHCDSNLAMLEAFENILGRELHLQYDADGNESEEQFALYSADCDLWNSSWDIAKKNNYFLK